MIIIPLKGWKGSNIWEQIVTNQNSIQEDLRTDWSQRMSVLSLGAEFWSPSLIAKNINFKIHWNIILPLVLYGCETWTLTLTEERRLRVSENRVLRRIFGLKREEVTRQCRKLHNEEPNDLYTSPSIDRVIKLRRMRGAGQVTRRGERRRGETWGK